MAKDDMTQEEQKKQVEAEQEKKQKAIEHLREDQKFYDARGYRDLRQFKSRYKKADGTDFEEELDPSGYSNVPGSKIKLEYGVYDKKGTNGKTRVHFDYDAKKDVYTFNVELTDRVATLKSFLTLGIAGGDNVAKKEPSWYQTWNSYARDKANEAVKFAARVGMTSIMPRFSGECPFNTKWGNIGPSSIQYHIERMKGACDAARKAGIGIDTSDPSFARFMSALEKYSRNEANEMKAAIAEANENGKKYDKLNDFINPKRMQEHQKNLAKADSINPEDVTNLMKSDIDAQKTKVENLQTELAKLHKQKADLEAKPPVDPAELAKLDTGIRDKTKSYDEAFNRLGAMNTQKDDIEAKVKPTSSYAELKELEDKWNDFKNPDQKFIDAVKELKGAMAEMKDRSSYTDLQKTKLDEFQTKINELETKLAKSPLSDVDRQAAEGELNKVIGDMKELANTWPDFKQKCDAAIDKADKYAKGERSAMGTVKHIEDRLAVLEKAAAELNNARTKYGEYDPKDFVGMIVGKQIALPWRDQHVRLKDEKEVKKYVDEHFNFGNLEGQRQALQTTIKEEKAKLDEMADPAKIDPAKAQAFKDRLAKVDVTPPAPSTAPKPGGSTVD